MSVEYRNVVGFPGYRVGKDASVWTCWKTSIRGSELSDRWKQLKPIIHERRGYLCVNLKYAKNKYKSRRIHRLMLEAFVGPCPEGMECRHLNGIETDNRLENLAWGTPSENRQDVRAHGNYYEGDDHPMAKLNAETVLEIRRRYAAGELQRVLAAEFGIGGPNVSCIVNRRSWTHI